MKVARFCLRIMLFLGPVIGVPMFWLGHLIANVVKSMARTIQGIRRIES